MQNYSPVKDTDGESLLSSHIGVTDSDVPALGTSVAGKWGVDGHVDGQRVGSGSKV